MFSPRRSIFVLAAALFAASAPAVELRAGSAEEIEHLLSYVGNSGCTFLRNGGEYSSHEAREHIQKKYEYVRDRVRSAEDFILYAATRSSMSGEPYSVRCNVGELPTAQWLHAELRRLREEREIRQPRNGAVP